MMYEPLDRPKGPPILLLIAGMAAAALLTLGAAVGTSMLHQQAPKEAKSSVDSLSAQRGSSGAASISRSAESSEL